MKYILIVSLFVLSFAAISAVANEVRHPAGSATEQAGSSAVVQPDGMGMGV